MQEKKILTTRLSLFTLRLISVCCLPLREMQSSLFSSWGISVGSLVSQLLFRQSIFICGLDALSKNAFLDIRKEAGRRIQRKKFSLTQKRETPSCEIFLFSESRTVIPTYARNFFIKVELRTSEVSKLYLLFSFSLPEKFLEKNVR